MHFPIIKLESLGTARADWDTDLDYEDVTLNYHTDYYGEMYSDAKRESVIRSKWLKELFEGLATIDEEKETITFLDKATILNTLHDYYIKTARELLERAERQQLSAYEFREAGRHFRDYYSLFVHDYGKTSMSFVEDAQYYAGETLQIGNIFDAHY